MSEPDWKGRLKIWVDQNVQGAQHEKEQAWDTLVPHLQAAYHRGLMAGRSQAGYRVKPAKAGLTERQLEIARLAGEGLTNKQIGERLYLSTHTVKTHLHHALKKTNARSRGHLAALLATQGHIAAVDVPDPKEG